MSGPEFSKHGAETQVHNDVAKHAIDHNEVLHDHDVLGNASVTKEDATHAAELTAEEIAVEKKLKRKIDLMIMPWVILVRRNQQIATACVDQTKRCFRSGVSHELYRS